MSVKAHPDAVAVEHCFLAFERIRAVPVNNGKDSERLLSDSLIVRNLKRNWCSSSYR
jgi:3-methyladenine DNA glycosylase Tag